MFHCTIGNETARVDYGCTDDFIVRLVTRCCPRVDQECIDDFSVRLEMIKDVLMVAQGVLIKSGVTFVFFFFFLMELTLRTVNSIGMA